MDAVVQREVVRVLLAGGGADLRRPVEMALRDQAGFVLSSCEELSGIAESAQRSRPHLLLFVHPAHSPHDLDHLESLKAVADVSGALVVVLSDRGDERCMERAFSLGVEDYLAPPPAPGILLLRLQALLSRYGEQNRLKQAAERFHVLASSVGEAIVAADGEGLITFWNTQAELLFGYSRREVLGQPVVVLIPERYRTAHQEGMQRVQRRRQHHRSGPPTESVGRHRDGHEFPIEIAPVYWVSEEGQPQFLAVVHDISERKRNEENNRRLLQSRQAISSLLNSALEPISLKEQLGVALDLILSVPWLAVQSKGAVFLFNEERRVLEMTVQKGLAGPLLTTCASVSPGRCLCGLAAESGQIVFARSVDERHHIVFPGMSPHGHYCVPIRTREQLFGVITLYVSEGHVRQSEEEDFLLSMAATLAGLIKRKQMVEELRRVAAAVEQSGDMILLTNAQGQIQYANPTFERLSGYTRAEVMGKPPSILGHDEENPTRIEQMRTTLAEGKTWRGRLLNRRKEGGTFEVESVISPVRDETGKIGSYVAVSRDVTEKSRLEGQLRHAQKLKSIGTLVNGIAHDFNNILGTIMGYSEMAMRNVSAKSKARRYLSKSLTASARARDLIGQLLTFSRPSEETQRPVLMAPLVREALRFMRATLPANITIRSRINSPRGAILADPTEIHQIVMNLCTNAYHAMRDGNGVLEVGLKELNLTDEQAGRLGLLSGPHLMLWVCDTGTGMPSLVKDRLFDPFFTTKGVGEGTGLGLSVVHGIVTRGNGAIDVESEPGEGTTFHLFFPRISHTELPADFFMEEEPQGEGRILLVDDEPEWLELAREGLSEMGFEVTALDDPKQAWNAFQEDPEGFDGVVTDFTMPRMTGQELAEKIFSVRPDLPVILCTADTPFTSWEKARKKGFSGYISKPVMVSDVGAALVDAFQGSRG